MEVVKYLAEAGADVRFANKNGITPVYVASENVSTDKVSYNKVLYMPYHRYLLYIAVRSTCECCY